MKISLKGLFLWAMLWAFHMEAEAEFVSSGFEEIDASRRAVLQSATTEANAQWRRADLYRWYRVLWHQGVDMSSLDSVRLEFKKGNDTEGGRQAVDRGYALMEVIQADPKKIEEIRGQPGSGTSTTDWPFFHGVDGHQTGYSPDAGPSEGRVAWKFAKGFTWNGTPVIADGRVYLTGPSGDTVAFCLDEATGEVLWKGRRLGSALYHGGTGSKWAPVVTKDRISVRTGWWQSDYVLTFDRNTGEKLSTVPAGQAEGGRARSYMAYKHDHAAVVLADAESGRAIWRFEAGAAISGEVALAGKRVYAALRNGEVLALDVTGTNRVAWKVQTGVPLRGSPSLGQEQMYLCDTDNSLLAVQRSDGQRLWTFQSDRGEERAYQFFGGAMEKNGRVYLGAADGFAYCLDAATGKAIWSRKLGDWIRSKPVMVGDLLYFACLDGKVFALQDRGDDSEVVWEREVSEHGFTADLAGSEQGILAGGRDLIAYSLNPASGTLQWKHSLLDAIWLEGVPHRAELHGGQFQSSPTVVDGVVYIGGPDGFVNAIDAETGEERWRFEANGRVQATPIVAEGKVFFGQDSAHGEFYALDKDTGELVWQIDDLGWVWAGAGYAKGRIFVGTVPGQVFGIRVSDGEILWTFDDAGGRGFHPNPATDESKVYTGSWNGVYYAFDQETGEVVWQTKTGTGRGGDPDSAAGVIWKDMLLVQERGSRITALSLEDGSRIWDNLPQAGFLQNGTPSVLGNTVFGSCIQDMQRVPGGAILVALDDRTGRELWRIPGGGGLTAPVVTDDKLVFGSTGDVFLSCVDHRNRPGEDGFLRWRLYLGGALEESVPALYGNKVFVMARNGYLFAVE